MTLVWKPRHGRTARLYHQHVATRLPGGETIELRPLRHGEVDSLRAVFEGMSPESRAARYLTGINRLTPGMSKALTDIDGHRHVAWVALMGGRPVGIARYLLDEAGVAEVAFEVVDACHDLGIGTALVDAVTTLAATRGVRRVRATLLPSNRPSRTLVARLGVLLVPSEGVLEGEGPLRLLDPPRVDRRAVVALAGRVDVAEMVDDPRHAVEARAE
jgi:RimJ/RimL family protein N-acetyltransferase